MFQQSFLSFGKHFQMFSCLQVSERECSRSFAIDTKLMSFSSQMEILIVPKLQINHEPQGDERCPVGHSNSKRCESISCSVHLNSNLIEGFLSVFAIHNEPAYANDESDSMAWKCK